MTDILARNLRPSPDAATSAVGEETVILHLVNGTYYGLDATGTRVWTLLEEGLAPAEVCRRLAGEFGIEQSIVETDVAAFLAVLVEQDIVIAT